MPLIFPKKPPKTTKNLTCLAQSMLSRNGKNASDETATSCNFDNHSRRSSCNKFWLTMAKIFFLSNIYFPIKNYAKKTTLENSLNAKLFYLTRNYFLIKNCAKKNYTLENSLNAKLFSVIQLPQQPKSSRTKNPVLTKFFI